MSIRQLIINIWLSCLRADLRQAERRAADTRLTPPQRKAAAFDAQLLSDQIASFEAEHARARARS